MDNDNVRMTKHNRSERVYVLFVPESGLFLKDSGELAQFGECTMYSAVEANRVVMEYFNTHKVFPVKMKVCPCRGVNPLTFG